MTAQDWNPDLYLKYGKERTQPSIDLASRIIHAAPRAIIDIGCGPGNSTQILAQRWPDAKITGVDNSRTMIEKARRDFPEQDWLLLDVGRDDIPGRYDIVYSNAAIQWIPGHAALLEKFHGILIDSGLLAVQVPLPLDMPVGQAIRRTAAGEPWLSKMGEMGEVYTIHSASFYYDRLSKLFSSVEMWQTDYMHCMPSHEAIIEMMRSTGLRPYLDRLAAEGDRQAFEAQMLAELRKD